MSNLMDNDGRVVDPELNALAQEMGVKFKELLDKRPDWTFEQVAASAFHLHGYLSSEVMRRIVGNLMKKRVQPGPGGSSEVPSLRPSSETP